MTDIPEHKAQQERSARQQRAMEAALAAEEAAPTGEGGPAAPPKKVAAPKPTDGSSEMKPGWYVDKRNNATRWHDGTDWTDAMEKPASPWNQIIFGFLFGVMGGVFIITAPDDEVLQLIGYIVVSLGTAIMFIGIIAEGVLIGNRHTVYDQQRREGGGTTRRAPRSS